jgi:LacI family transcriptional regulator
MTVSRASEKPCRNADDKGFNGDVQIENGLDAGRQLLSLSTLPTAIIANNNKLLLGVLQALEEGRIQVPGQLSVVGFDDYIWNRHFNPSLTAIAQPTHEMGRRAFELLLTIINRLPGEELAERNVRLAAELRVRNSTSAPPTESSKKLGNSSAEALSSR